MRRFNTLFRLQTFGMQFGIQFGIQIFYKEYSYFIKKDRDEMEKHRLSKEEIRIARAWAADTSWVEKKAYERDNGYLGCVEDILAHPVFQSMDQYIQHGNTTCKAHCIQVSYMSYRICRARGWDYRAAARAGLLHDLFLYDWHTHARETGEYFHGFTHPRTAMNNAMRHFQLSDREQNLILRHMWPLTPVPPRYKEGFAVLYADKFCGLSEVASNIRQWFLYTLQPKQLG